MINFSACSICDFCFSFARIRFTSDCNALTFSCNSAICTFGSTGASTFAFFSATRFSWDFGVSTTSVLDVEITSVFGVAVVPLFVVGTTSGCTVVSVTSDTFFSLSSVPFSWVVTTVVPLTTSLASTWCPKKKPAPISTLAAPTFNFFMEYFSNLCPAFCWFTYSLFFPTIFHLKIK